MRKTVLPLPESFTIHATALVNHVHNKVKPPKSDPGKSALDSLRRGVMVVTMADMRSPFAISLRVGDRRA
jgi:hypothetical protein